MFIHHMQTATLRAIREHAQSTPSLLRRRIFALYHHQWAWSSFRHYAVGEHGPVLVNEAQKAELRVRNIA
jgi:hypothetical protein